MSALERAAGDGDRRLVCSDCRQTAAARCRPISLQLKHKAENLRRAERRAVELRAALDGAKTASVWDRATYSRQELRRQLVETESAICRHRTELVVLQTARARGATERIAISRRTAHYGRSVLPPSTKEKFP